MTDKERAKELIYEAIKELPPRIALEVLHELANNMHKVVAKYDNLLSNELLG